jgi:septum formation protein
MSTKTTSNPPPPEPRRAPGSRPLVLASTSRYRRALLEQLGLPFTVATPATDESPLPGEPPVATALRLAEAKARSVAAGRRDALVIGSDQVADCEGRAVGKPVDHADAVAQLTRLSGRTVVFHTGLALVDAASGDCQTAMVDVTSTFRELAPAEIEAYLARDRPYDCAASVKSDALGIALFVRIESDDPSALVGLPLIRLTDMLRAAGVSVLAPPA